ncbi:D-glycero-beta-D-manno-heptose 1,7-bisphosphate 7-phosphatase [Thalassotalea sp. 1_MG-2023]|uniref:D-glycero-beta-D-manno-heptose 1,7-bisphosphate 7-phosphatase n=1 Tax=Thalassotalea sp. 1_MG-2023 TaxID=3062680 RepID=UPI0026E42BDA|nr:D-glycero-beta-D-manno-heptose 1,7-bisphosphate 7-phosphatase [Thalassotalea sp. 1_MG-2023]MDO6427260.1 D-glycero-beta-D-manno-heptose 1,7-bisphosphate 7-phosphatase [Thalassotalea sp. 1_MG-2023]
MNKALFLDRDGIINVDHGYVYQQQDFEFTEGIFELCQHATKLGYLLIVITNQSGIARGKYTEADFLTLTEWMKTTFNQHNCLITDVFFCPHHPTKGKGEYLKTCQCRKPEPGLILQAATKYNIDLSQSVFIGDKVSDMQAAESAGINNRILVASQYNDSSLETARSITEIADARAFIV